MNIATARAAIKLLEAVARKQMVPTQALREWPGNVEGDPLVEASWHDLSHFANDEDIRARDPRYAEYQSRGLLDRVKAIRARFNLE